MTTMTAGVVQWMGVRPARGEPMIATRAAEAIASRGLAGDRAATGKRGGKRQITLVQAEDLPIVEQRLALPVAPAQLRRNLVVAGIDLRALVNGRFAIGDDVILVGTGPCDPCRKLDRLIGPGGFAAMRGCGGITARIERGGALRIGDRVRTIGQVELSLFADGP